MAYCCLKVSLHPIKVCSFSFIFDSSLSLIPHIHDVSKSCNTAKVEPLLSITSAISVIHTLAISCLDYCNRLLPGLLSLHLGRPSSSQNSVAKVISLLHHSDHMALRLDPLHSSIQHQLLLLNFKGLP